MTFPRQARVGPSPRSDCVGSTLPAAPTMLRVDPMSSIRKMVTPVALLAGLMLVATLIPGGTLNAAGADQPPSLVERARTLGLSCQDVETF